MILLLLVIFTVIIIRIWKRGLKKSTLHYQKDIAAVVDNVDVE
jgi:hypothetical protein